MKHKEILILLFLVLPAQAQDVILTCTGDGKSITVKRGETLSGLSDDAQRFYRPDLSRETLSNAIFEANKYAFVNNNRDIISAEATLHLPCDLLGIVPIAIKPKPAPPSPPPPPPSFWENLSLIVATSGVFFLLLLGGYFFFRRSKPEAELFEQSALPAPLKQGMAQILEGINASDKQIAILNNAFGTLRSALDEKDTEIKRLKKGYDAHLFKQFLVRFIRVDQLIADFMQDENSKSDALDTTKQLLEDAFADCGVESFSPAIGEDYRRATGVAANPKTQHTDNPQDNYKITEVLQAGYRRETDSGFDVVYPAKVKIFITQ